MTSPSYTITDESITLIWEGKPVTVKKGAPNYAGLRKAILSEDWGSIPGYLTVKTTIETWSHGAFKANGNTITYNDDEIPRSIHDRIYGMLKRGEEPTALLRFYERLSENPSRRSVEQLFPFMEHQGIPLEEDGTFLAYKSVKSDYTDKHTGTIDNTPGTKHKMARNKVSDDPREACHFGFHVGSLKYAKDIFGGAGDKMVICRVDPKDVVSVPYDHSQQKMRVCAYEVVGNYGGQMPSTVIPKADVPKIEKQTKASTLSTNKAATTTDPTWDELDTMQHASLMEVSLDILRKYASHKLKIVGASKIPGGKYALVCRIMDVRE